jgi:hypothetical protein
MAWVPAIANSGVTIARLAVDEPAAMLHHALKIVERTFDANSSS